MSNSLSFSDILARGVAIEWHEAVALVRAVAERVRDDHGGNRVPELYQIEIASDGTVAVAGAVPTDEPVRRLGQLLQAALEQSDSPMQLRLLITQATAPLPAFESVHAYWDALGYFERPDRTALLRMLYSRAAAVPDPAVAPILTLDTVAPLRAPEPEKARKPVRPKASRRSVQLLAAAVVLIVAAAAYWTVAGTGAQAPQLSRIAVKATDAVGTALVSGMSSVSEAAGLGRFAPREGSPGSKPPAPAPPATVASAKRPAKRVTAGKPTARPFSLQAFDLDQPPAPLARPVFDFIAPNPPLIATVPSLVMATVVAEAADHIYSASDAVTPPVGVRPQLPRTLPPDVDKDQLTHVELIITPTGTVDSLRLLGPPRNVHESMLLSAAKAWQFIPAMKDGHPVTYRKIIWLSIR